MIQKIKTLFLKSSTVRRNYLILMMMLFAAGYIWLPTQASGEAFVEEKSFKPFSLFSDPKYTSLEIFALFAILIIAIAGLLYALMLVKQVRKADEGTQKMKDIAAAVREGANAYLSAQFKRIGPLIIIM